MTKSMLFSSIPIFLVTALGADSTYPYTHVKVREDSFYSFETITTSSLSSCANICTSAIKKGKRVQGCVFRPKEKTCTPTELAPFESDTNGLRDEDLTDALIFNGTMNVRDNHGSIDE